VATGFELWRRRRDLNWHTPVKTRINRIKDGQLGCCAAGVARCYEDVKAIQNNRVRGICRGKIIVVRGGNRGRAIRRL